MFKKISYPYNIQINNVSLHHKNNIKNTDMKTFKRHKDYGFWDQDLRLTKLSKLGDPLDRLNKWVDFEIFRTLLEEKLSKLPKAPGGCPPYDYVMMFKVLILQRYYNLSDDQIEFQINDRLSFMRFLDLTIADDIPDSRTVWHFREQITDLGLVEELFDLFLKALNKLGLIINEGKIIDAGFVEVPR
jgi:transposase